MSIRQVRHDKNFDAHKNEDRTIVTVFKEDIPGFDAAQVRVAQLHRDTSAGNHWREYSELYAVIGEASFTLEDIDSQEKKSYVLRTGDRLFVPARVALQINAKKGTVIIACAAETDREGKTHKYVFN